MNFLFGKQIFFSIPFLWTTGCAHLPIHPEVEKEIENDIFHESAHLLQERVNQ